MGYTDPGGLSWDTSECNQDVRFHLLVVQKVAQPQDCPLPVASGSHCPLDSTDESKYKCPDEGDTRMLKVITIGLLSLLAVCWQQPTFGQRSNIVGACSDLYPSIALTDACVRGVLLRECPSYEQAMEDGHAVIAQVLSGPVKVCELYPDVAARFSDSRRLCNGSSPLQYCDWGSEAGRVEFWLMNPPE